MSYLLASLFITLAGYRTWRVLGLDQITEALRNRLDRSTIPAVMWLADMIVCAWCLGFWITGGLTLVSALVWNWGVWPSLLIWGATSTLVGFIGKFDNE